MDALIIWKHSKVSSKDINDVICKSISFFLCSYCHSMQRGMNLPLQNCLLLIMKIFWPPPYRAGQAPPPPLPENENFLQIFDFCQFPCHYAGFSRSYKEHNAKYGCIFNRSSNHKLWGDWKAKTTRPYYIQPNWIILKF